MKKLEIAATYLAGRDPDTGLQYHVQITAIHSPHPKWDAVDAGRECPDYAAAATLAQLEGSEDHIVLGELSNLASRFAQLTLSSNFVVCATLGELNEHNKNSWVKQNRQNPYVTTNIKVQVTLDEKD